MSGTFSKNLQPVSQIFFWPFYDGTLIFSQEWDNLKPIFSSVCVYICLASLYLGVRSLKPHIFLIRANTVFISKKTLLNDLVTKNESKCILSTKCILTVLRVGKGEPPIIFKAAMFLIAGWENVLDSSHSESTLRLLICYSLTALFTVTVQCSQQRQSHVSLGGLLPRLSPDQLGPKLPNVVGGWTGLQREGRREPWLTVVVRWAGTRPLLTSDCVTVFNQEETFCFSFHHFFKVGLMKLSNW